MTNIERYKVDTFCLKCYKMVTYVNVKLPITQIITLVVHLYGIHILSGTSFFLKFI